MSHDRDGRAGQSGLRDRRTLTGKVGFNVDLALIALTMVVTVPRVGWWMARWEQADLWFVGYAAAVVFDLAILRLAYVWSRATARRQRIVTMAGFLFFSICSGLFQAFYLLEQQAALQQAVPLAAIWPVALGILALHKAGQDERQERRLDRSKTRQSRVPSNRPARPGAPSAGHAARTGSGRDTAWTSDQRKEALQLATSGLSVRQVAGRLAIPRSTVGAWVRATSKQSGAEQREIDSPLTRSMPGTPFDGRVAADESNATSGTGA